MTMERSGIGSTSPPSCSLSVDGTLRVVRRVWTHSDTEFYGLYKGCTIHCEREDDEPRWWYIQVRYKDGGLLYDGYAPDEIETTEQAIAEAIRGACL